MTFDTPLRLTSARPRPPPCALCVQPLATPQPALANVAKILVYAPGNETGRNGMAELLGSMGLSVASSVTSRDDGDDDDRIPRPESSGRGGWFLLPILEETSDPAGEMRRSDLGSKLSDALVKSRSVLARRSARVGLSNCQSVPSSGGESGSGSSRDDSSSVASIDGEEATSPPPKGPVMFLGMDAPELPLSEMVYALREATSSSEGEVRVARAYLCPAADGGYGMLCVPPSAPPDIFDGVRWSDKHTALSQLKAITDLGIDVKLGAVMHDIDEPDDVFELAKRLCRDKSGPSGEGGSDDRSNLAVDVLTRTPPGGEDAAEFDYDSCAHTWSTLAGLGLIESSENGTFAVKEVGWNAVKI